MYHYQTGEEVRSGDEIEYSEWGGIVEFIINPGSNEASDYSVPNGGVMLLFFTGGRVLLDTTDEEEDLVFVQRFNDSIPAKFEKYGQLCKMCYADGSPLLAGDEVELCRGDGSVCKAQVIAVYPPFEKSSWEVQMPTGGVLLDIEGGSKIRCDKIPSSMQKSLRTKCSVK